MINLFEESKKYVPGGVHSPVRSFEKLSLPPLVFNKAEGAKIYDQNGKNYIDFCMSFGPMILGHQNPQVKKSLIDALDNGWTFGAIENYSFELSKFIVDQISFIDKIRFVNSGTEAVMTALRLARAFTKKDKIIKFNGCYHGHVDSMLIQSGSGLAGQSEASSDGIPQSILNDTIVLELNNLESLKNLLTEKKEEIAALIIEPLPANYGLIHLSEEYLVEVFNLCKANNVLIIFDEVISGFRVGFEGMSGELGLEPDIVTYGKVIGGGLPVGAIAAKNKIMNLLAPLGNVYQAGTLSANPLAMRSGLETLKQLDDVFYKNLYNQTTKIRDLFNSWLKEYNQGKFSHYCMKQKHSLLWFSLTTDLPLNVQQIPNTITKEFQPLYKTLLDKGVYFAPNPYEVGFVSDSHNDEVINQLKDRLWS